MLYDVKVTDRTVTKDKLALAVMARLPVRDGTEVVEFPVALLPEADMASLACKGSTCRYRFRVPLLVLDPATGDPLLRAEGKWQENFTEGRDGVVGTVTVHNELLEYIERDVGGSYRRNSEAIDRVILFGHRMVELGFRPYVSDYSDRLPVQWDAAGPAYAYTSFKYGDRLVLTFKAEDAGDGRLARLTIAGMCSDAAVDCRDVQAGVLAAIPEELRLPGALRSQLGTRFFSVVLDYSEHVKAGVPGVPKVLDALESVALPAAKKVKEMADLSLSRGEEVPA